MCVRAHVLTRVLACDGAHVRVCVCVRECVLVRVGVRLYVRSCVGCAYVPRPPKLNGCGKLQIFILSVKKLENSSTHDFAQHIAA